MAGTGTGSGGSGIQFDPAELEQVGCIHSLKIKSPFNRVQTILEATFVLFLVSTFVIRSSVYVQVRFTVSNYYYLLRLKMAIS